MSLSLAIGLLDIYLYTYVYGKKKKKLYGNGEQPSVLKPNLGIGDHSYLHASATP